LIGTTLKILQTSRISALSFFFFLVTFSFSQTSPFLDSLLKGALATYSSVLSQPNKYKLQVVYTKIDRNKKNEPSFTEYKFHLNKEYVYPASVVKLPVSLVALIKLQSLGEKGVDRNTSMLTDSAFYCQKRVFSDTTSFSDFPTVGNYISKMLLVSDNTACARTYEFVGCDYLHQKLEELGYPDIRIVNRLDGACQGDTAKTTPPVYFLNEKKDTIYRQPLTFSHYKKTHPIADSKVGKAGGEKDFARHNYLPLHDLHDIMRRTVFNNHLSGDDKLPLSEDNWKFMMTQLGRMPKES
jgi:hypothetical protein